MKPYRSMPSGGGEVLETVRCPWVPAPTRPLLSACLKTLGLVGSVTFVLELSLIGHVTPPLQVIAVGAAAFGAVGSFAAFWHNAVARLVALASALGLLLAGLLGAAIHLGKNLRLVEAQTMWAALSGPLPVFAPLSLANLGLLILLALWIGLPRIPDQPFTPNLNKQKRGSV